MSILLGVYITVGLLIMIGELYKQEAPVTFSCVLAAFNGVSIWPLAVIYSAVRKAFHE